MAPARPTGVVNIKPLSHAPSLTFIGAAVVSPVRGSATNPSDLGSLRAQYAQENAEIQRKRSADRNAHVSTPNRIGTDAAADDQSWPERH